MAVLHSRTFWFAKAEWYEAWIAHFENIYVLEEALQKVWGRKAKLQIRQDYILEVTFTGLNDRSDDALVRSVFDALRTPLPPSAHALDVVGDILHEGP